MLGRGLLNLLEDLDLISNRSVFFRNKEDGEVFVFTAELQKKLDIIKPDAAFVFNNKPFILFFDFCETDDLNRENEIHKQAWSFDYAPLIFIVKENQIQIFNAFSYDKKKDRLQELKISNDEINQRFSFFNLQSGESWKWLQEEYYKSTIQKKRVNQKLFENIKLVRETLTADDDVNCLLEDEANILILRLIFIRYLIDRDVKMDTDYINGDTILKRRASFGNLIKEQGKLNQFFEQLNQKFNGVLFKDIILNLSQEQASYLSWIFNGRSSTQPDLFEGTDYYFDIFDFSIIPVEVISGIYESLISEETRNEQSAIYTPSFLVEYVLAETIETFLHSSQTSECKVFDPSCGSGIFLVQSYRKMVDQERMLIGTKIAQNRLREIAQNNLFGIDINAQALKVTCFSIYIAILDYQDPKTILDNFAFPELIGENLFEANFFDVQHPFNAILKTKHLNFILGNPPWKSGVKDKMHLEYLQKNNLLDIVSDFQLAQSFLIRTKDISGSTPICSLVITSKAIYNTYAENFKKFFLKHFYLYKCLDLSPVRRLIFEGADNPAMVIQFQYADNEDTSKNVVVHRSLKYNIYLKHYKTLVIEKNDYKRINQHFFYEVPWAFKVALYGGKLDYALLKRIKGDTIDAYLTNENIISGNGIQRGTPDRHFTDLIGLPIIESSEIKEFYTPIRVNAPLMTKENSFLQWGRDVKIFKGKKIVFSKRVKNETTINISLIEQDAIFKDSLTGISFNESQEESLSLLFSIFTSNLFTYYQYLTCSNWGIYLPEIYKKEFYSFPIKEFLHAEVCRLKQLVDNIITNAKEWHNEFKLGSLAPPTEILKEINEVINNKYSITSHELDLIDYALNISRYQFQGEKKQKVVTDFTFLDSKHYRNRDSVLRKFAEVFIREFDTLYKDEFMQIEVYPLNHFIAMNFKFVENSLKSEDKIVFITATTDEKKVLQIIADNLSISKIMSSNDPTKNIYIQKDIKGFEKNSFYIIKPNEYKCWHRAMAWYDVAEIKDAIEQAELTHLKVAANGA